MIRRTRSQHSKRTSPATSLKRVPVDRTLKLRCRCASVGPKVSLRVGAAAIFDPCRFEKTVGLRGSRSPPCGRSVACCARREHRTWFKQRVHGIVRPAGIQSAVPCIAPLSLSGMRLVTVPIVPRNNDTVQSSRMAFEAKSGSCDVWKAHSAGPSPGLPNVLLPVASAACDDRPFQPSTSHVKKKVASGGVRPALGFARIAGMR